MRKKIFGFVLLGAFTMFALSAVTSCKKYDDDIDDLQSQVTANQQALEQAKAALETTITGLQSQLEAARSDVSANAALIAGLEARLATAEKALGNLESIPATLAALGATVTGLEGTVGTLSGTVSGLSQTVTDLSAKLGVAISDVEAAKIAIQTQIDALKRLEQAQTEQGTKIQEIIAKLQQIDVNTGDIATLKADLQKASDEVAKFDGRINTLEDLLGSSVRSLVFVPDFYYYGIEATELNTMNYKYYNTIGVADANYDGEKQSQYNSTRYTTSNGFNVLNFTATYHVNPASAKFDDATFKLLSDDKEYTRSAAAGLRIEGTPVKGTDGNLVVNLGVTNPNAVKSIAASGDTYVTVFATEVTLPTADKAGTYTVTSDYAAVRAVKKDGGYRLSNVCKAVGHENLDATAAERVTMTGVLNPNGMCSTTTPASGLHMFATFNECAYPAGRNVQPAEDMLTTKLQDAQALVMWNEELNLLRLVETHYAANDQPVKVKDMAANNLSYKFEIIGSKYGTNQTSEGAHANIKDNIFRPQMPTAEGKQDAFGGTQAVSTVGRQPVVRVQLIDTQKNEILDYGYIRIRIIDKQVQPQPKGDEYIEFNGGAYSYTINHGCVETPYTNYTWENSWDQVEYRLYHDKLNISHEAFLQHYHAVLASSTTLTAVSGADLAQYKATQLSGGGLTFNLCTNADKMGSFEEVPNVGSGETNTLKWFVTANEMKAAYPNVGTYTLARAIKYESNDPINYPNLYVLVTSGTITIADGGKASGVFNLDPNKNANYWYKHNSNVELSGKDEARINVVTPDKATGSNADPFESVLASQFVGNKIGDVPGQNILTVTDPTTDNAFAKSKLTFDLVFDVSNVGARFKGQTGTVYVLSVDATGKELYADVDGVVDPKQLIAKLDIANASLPASVNNTKLAYQHGTYAEDLLNVQKYNEMTDDMILAVIAIKVKNQCGMELPVTGNTFNERFVRPINVYNNDAQIQDAAQQGAAGKQTVNLIDLVSMNDWRSYEFADYPNFWTFYNIQSITVRGASAGTSINSLITTDMDGGNIETTKLSTKSNDVEFNYLPVTPATPSATAYYGCIEYTNNGNNVGTFKVKIPVRVTYQWGCIDAYATITVNKTHGAK